VIVVLSTFCEIVANGLASGWGLATAPGQRADNATTDTLVRMMIHPR